MMMKLQFTILLAMSLLFAACIPRQEAPRLVVSLVADGRERTFEYTTPMTVGDFLRDAEIELGELDQVNPPEFTQITDGMRITVVRVVEQTECEEIEIPFRQRSVPNEGLQPGEQRLGQAGQNGVERVCYRVSIRDGEARDRVEISRDLLSEAQDEVVYVGLTNELEPVAVEGSLGYINNRNAWLIRGNSTTKRPLTTTGDVDGRVFSLSSDGRRLLFTRQSFTDGQGEFNQLWLIANTENAAPEPVNLVPTNILFAEWVPSLENTISYSTAEARQAAPGWQAYNDLWLMRIDPLTGESLNARELVKRSSGGLYGWWGTRYQWSPSGTQLAWVRADSIGLVNLESGELAPLLDYPVFNTFQPWSWRATLSWSPDEKLIATTVHGLPIGSEPPETSPAFHVAVADNTGTFNAEVVKNAGIWAAPSYSPLLNNPENQFPQGYLAYLKCRDFPNCISSSAEYDLIVADRDGSNARVVFPEAGQPGLTAQEFVWSPSGRQIAFIYQGNLWIIDVVSQVANQLTLDGGASKPVWTS